MKLGVTITFCITLFVLHSILPLKGTLGKNAFKVEPLLKFCLKNQKKYVIALHKIEKKRAASFLGCDSIQNNTTYLNA